MRKFYSILGLLLMCGTSLFAQTNYTVTFTANVEMEKVQVKNLSSGETKMLYSPDNVITLQKNAKQDQQGGTGTPIESVDQFEFLQQTASNEVIVNMEKAGHLNLTLYSSNGSFIARYSNNVDAGQNAFQIGASTGMYVLVATAGGKSASLKLSLTQNLQPGIYEIITSKSDVFLKSVEDVITFYEGDTFEFTGYYYRQTDKKTAAITSDQAITFSFTKATAPTVTTVQATNITYDAATVGGNVTKDNGAPVTERGICWNTTGNPTIADNKETSGTGTGSFSVTLSSLSDGTTYHVRAYATNRVGTAYGDEITFATEKTVVEGVLMGSFSIGDRDVVHFSKGNLQYQASTGTWRFAEHQYDKIGSSNSKISSSYSGWIDLFGWGTSGWDSGANEYQPYSTNFSNGNNYCPGGWDGITNNLTGKYANADWGVYNKISNGGNQAGMWFTLTSAQWKFLINSRANASSKYGVATVNNVKGLVLLPDDWTWRNLPADVTLTFTSGASGDYTQNKYTAEEWSMMEEYGAVFLPAAGYRYGTDVAYVDSFGYYWSSSANSNDGACYLGITPSLVYTGAARHRFEGLSVRLVVRDVE